MRLNIQVDFRKILVRFARDSAIPMLLALGYAYWASGGNPMGRHPTEFIKNFGGAYFLLMWFAGQLIRVSKHIRDEAMLADINANVATIRHLVEQDNAADFVAPAELRSGSLAGTLAKEAQQAMESGLRLSAILSVAVAFERAIREFANRRGIQNSDHLPVPQVIRGLREHLEAGVAEDLMELWKARNAVVHFSEADLARRPEVVQLMHNFSSAIELLNRR